MNSDRRKFLQQMAAVCAGGVARTLGIGCTTAVAAHASVATTAAVAAGATAATAGAYGASIRGQVFEVIVRQGMAGAPWREICAGPMQINNITEAEIQTEINRRSFANGHQEANDCNCSLCVSKRHFEHRRQLLSQIKHSEKSPCACPECYKVVQQIIADAVKSCKI
ncbi:MAG: hypothetical protein JST89_03505 [Cyanobacteria bacterium SZAS-4]|nr:hypothetical protein [Cyanobacteria bacterium SZAS-4]